MHFHAQHTSMVYTKRHFTNVQIGLQHVSEHCSLAQLNILFKPYINKLSLTEILFCKFVRISCVNQKKIKNLGQPHCKMQFWSNWKTKTKIKQKTDDNTHPSEKRY